MSDEKRADDERVKADSHSISNMLREAGEKLGQRREQAEEDEFFYGRREYRAQQALGRPALNQGRGAVAGIVDYEDRRLRERALEMAIYADGSQLPGQQVKRASTYLAFLKGEPAQDPCEP